ncbi:S-adenosyl-L-methionine-dependent methyltransferase [Choiromyces venosus 120613-1]|uniref:S-adenosyl-L-methionine-dependent methyltransferase n=1 Tax=Choiromyces venosus 120613-1 TaxID=1336337 RepID=A0A3N4J452_9PEZI|nr:S-adenosyl-L-methionine-dependent methyltransferase [Choiromyces venosus 120613-1]
MQLPGDDDSTFGSSTESEVSSASSGILNYEYENGRRYHSFRQVRMQRSVLPNDVMEQERCVLSIHRLKIILGGELTMAPLNMPQNILDVGTGTGIWAIDAADRYPTAIVLGNDLSAIQPAWVPPNCRFEVDDAESEWVYPEETFDLVHTRFMLGSIKDWNKYFEQAFRHIKSGGYLEVKEGVLEVYSQRGPCTENIAKFFELLRESGTKSGRPMTGVEDFKSKMEAVGFEDVQERIDQLPVGRWPKDKRLSEIGMYTQLVHLEGVSSYGSALFTRVLGWAPSDAARFFEQVCEEFQDNRNLFYTLRYNLVGRKPLNPPPAA